MSTRGVIRTWFITVFNYSMMSRGYAMVTVIHACSTRRTTNYDVKEIHIQKSLPAVEILFIGTYCRFVKRNLALIPVMSDKSTGAQHKNASSKKTRHKTVIETRRSKEDLLSKHETKTNIRTKPTLSKKKLNRNSDTGLDGKPNQPSCDQNTIRTKTTFVKQLVRETLCQFDESIVESADGLLKNRKGVFLGEFQFEEESQCSEVLRESFGRSHVHKTALTKFRKMVKYVITAQRLTKRSSHDVRKPSREDTMFLYLTLTDSATQSEDHSDRPLFDLTPFKSIGEKNFSLSVKSVLEIEHTERTEHQVNTMMHMLRTFGKFSSYPYQIQRGICRQGWYARFEGARVICREGNRAEYYYLILSGVAVTHRTVEDKSCGKTSRLLRRGDTIGEKEMLTQTDRDATVISREPLEVLGVDGDDLLNIFRSAGTLDHLDFLRSIPDIQLFPLTLLQAYDFSCSAHYYRRGSVIVKDSNEAEWIYIVKTGSCQVYKAIKISDDTLEASDGMYTRRNEGVRLPNILPDVHPAGLHQGLTARHPAVQRVADMERSITYDSIQTKRKVQLLKKNSISSSNLELPTIKPGQVSMVSSEHDWVTETSQMRKSFSARSKRRKSGKKQPLPAEGKKSVYYAKLDIVTEKECFGLQTLIYEDMPGLSLVSNGTECILISKQFFRHNLTDDIINHLKTLVSPYPNLDKLQKALSQQVKWGSYKEQVLHDSLQ